MTGEPGRLRPYRPADRDAVAEICLRTARAGADATGVLPDDRLWADLYALPYVELEPELAFVVDSPPDGVVGYVVGTADSAAFAEDFRRRWLPRVSQRYPAGPREDPLEADLLAALHDPDGGRDPGLQPYPAHLHIDLLPPAQGRGWGRALMTTFFRAVRERGAPGVHLAVDPANQAALAFYARLGLRELVTDRGTYLVAASDLL